MGPGSDHGQQSSFTSVAATELMLGHTLLAGQLRDLRAAWRHFRKRADLAPKEALVIGESGVTPLSEGVEFSFPRRIDGRPPESLPSAALLALLLALYEDDVFHVSARFGLASYRSLLDSPFVQTPLDSIPPGIFAAGDISDLVSALAPKSISLVGPIDGRGRFTAP
jgi:hypothetical protein